MSDLQTAARQETSLRDFLDVLFRRKWPVISIVVLATVLVVFLNERQPKVWESSSRVLVRRGEQASLLNANVRVMGWEEEVASEVQVILSEDVFGRARTFFADSVQVHGYPSDWKFNAAAVRAEVMGESNAFVIRYSDPNPDVVQLGCEVATIGYHDFYRERKAPPELSDFFASEISDVRTELDSWRAKRQKFMDDEQYLGTNETGRFLLNRISVLEDKVSELNGDVSSQQMRTDSFARLLDKSGEQLEAELAFSLSQYVLQGGILQNIKFALQNLHLKHDELTQKYTDRHPEVIAVDEQIARLRADLKQQVLNAYNIEAASLKQVQARRAQLLAELNDARTELETMPDKERRLAEIDAMIEKLDERHRLLLQRQSEAEIAQAGHPEWDVAILSHASKPYSKKTRDYVRLAIGPLLSLIVGFGLAFFMESMDHSIKNAAEAEEYLDAPVLVTISDLEARRRKTVGHDV